MLHAEVVVRRGAFDLDVAVSVPPGEAVAVMGPNGSGKSTLLDAIAGLVNARGTVRVGERMLTGRGVRVPVDKRRVGLLSQDPLLFPHLSALENVAFGPRSRGVPRAVAREAAARSLAELGLAGLEGRRPRQLSGGQQQRVALARVLAAEPDVLLLDEPMAALDVESEVLVRAHLSRWCGERSIPVVTVTHDVADAFALATRTVLLDAGRVVQEGATSDVLATLRAGVSVDAVVSDDGRVMLPEGVELAPGQRVTVSVDR